MVVWTACWSFLPNYPSPYNCLSGFVYSGWTAFVFLPFFFSFQWFSFYAFKISLCFESSKYQWASESLFTQMKINRIFELSLFSGRVRVVFVSIWLYYFRDYFCQVRCEKSCFQVGFSFDKFYENFYVYSSFFFCAKVSLLFLINSSISLSVMDYPKWIAGTNLRVLHFVLQLCHDEFLGGTCFFIQDLVELLLQRDRKSMHLKNSKERKEPQNWRGILLYRLDI